MAGQLNENVGAGFAYVRVDERRPIKGGSDEDGAREEGWRVLTRIAKVGWGNSVEGKRRTW